MNAKNVQSLNEEFHETSFFIPLHVRGLRVSTQTCKIASTMLRICGSRFTSRTTRTRSIKEAIVDK